MQKKPQKIAEILAYFIFLCNFAAKLVKIFEIYKFFAKKMTKICVFYNETLKKRIDRVNFRTQVLIATGWAYTTFYNKMRSGKFKNWELEKVLPIVDNFKPSIL